MLLLAAAATAAVACHAEPARRQGPAFGRDAAAFTPKGWIRESVHQLDLNGDGTSDTVLVAREPEGEGRRLIATIATPRGLRNVGEATLPAYSLGDASFELTAKGVLVVTDLCGGTTANQSVMRYRYEGPSAMQGAMRYIGLDIGHYSRTNQHDALNLSFNWLTGDFSKQVDKLTRRGDYAPQKAVRGKEPPRCMFMEDTEDPDNYVAAELEEDPD
jgi:hypothetical protein